jgi:hypothetical protein
MINGPGLKMSERIIAICSPELHGDMLWSVPAARALAARHGCRADFWISHRGGNAADLLEAQSFVRHAIVEKSWYMDGDCSTVEVVDGVQVRTLRGKSHIIHNAFRPEHGYEMVYNLGFSETKELNGTLLDYFCDLAGVGRQSHYFDLPSDCPKEPVPEGPFVALEGKYKPEATRTGWWDVFRDFVKHCPIPVVEVCPPGRTCALDLGSIDRARDGFLEMAGVISKCKYYIGNISAPLVVADAFPHVIRIGVYQGDVDLRHCTKSEKNFYPRAAEYQELLNYIEEAK